MYTARQAIGCHLRLEGSQDSPRSPGPYRALRASRIRRVTGPRVRRGQRIGLAAARGSCSGTHLHSIRAPGVPSSPAPRLKLNYRGRRGGRATSSTALGGRLALFLDGSLVATTRGRTGSDDGQLYSSARGLVAQTGSCCLGCTGLVRTSPALSDPDLASVRRRHVRRASPTPRLNAFLIATAAIPSPLARRSARAADLALGRCAGVAFRGSCSRLSPHEVAPIRLSGRCSPAHAVARKWWATDLRALFAIGHLRARLGIHFSCAACWCAVVVEAMLDAAARRTATSGAPGAPRPPLGAVLPSCWFLAIARAGAARLLLSQPRTCGSLRALRCVRAPVAARARVGDLPSSRAAGSSTPPPSTIGGGPFAVVGCTALCCYAAGRLLQPAFGAGLVKDRYLFYVVPIVCSSCRRAPGGSRQWPRWWRPSPTGVAAVGFASAPLALYEKLNVDSPVAS